MMVRVSSANPALSRMVEKQMRNWELARTQQAVSEPVVGAAVPPFVAISRAVGCGGSEVAARLADQLHWPMFDKEILHVMAGDDRMRGRIYNSMDERDVGWFEGAIRSFTDPDFARNDYFRRLTETVLSLARQGSAVYQGRGIHRLLPAECGLRVRLTAPQDRCVARVAQREAIRLEQARERIEQIERERADFVRNHFHVEADDPTTFDLVLNLEWFSATDAVDLIRRAMELRGITE